MKCPQCGQDMVKGYVQSGTHIIWTEKKHRVSLLPKNNDVLLARNYWGGAVIEGFLCDDCQNILIDFSKLEIK